MAASDGDVGEPSVLLIVPAYNAAETLRETIASVQAQEGVDWQCVIVDDGSTDETEAISERLARDDDRIVVISVPNGGVSSARNVGLRAAAEFAYDYLVFLDADDLLLPGHLTTLHSALRSHPNAIGAHCLAEKVDDVGEVIRPGWFEQTGRGRHAIVDGNLRQLAVTEPTDFNVLVEGFLMFPPAVVMLSRAAVEATGEFDPQSRGGEDQDYFTRASRRGVFAFVDAVLVHYRQTGETNATAQDFMAKEVWRVRCKTFHSPDNTPAQSRYLRASWAAYQNRLLRERCRASIGQLRTGHSVAAARLAIKAAACLVRLSQRGPRPRIR